MPGTLTYFLLLYVYAIGILPFTVFYIYIHEDIHEYSSFFISLQKIAIFHVFPKKMF